MDGERTPVPDRSAVGSRTPRSVGTVVTQPECEAIVDVRDIPTVVFGLANPLGERATSPFASRNSFASGPHRGYRSCCADLSMQRVLRDLVSPRSSRERLFASKPGQRTANDGVRFTLRAQEQPMPLSFRTVLTTLRRLLVPVKHTVKAHRAVTSTHSGLSPAKGFR